MSSQPRVLVSGYYGFGNAGDEAILAGLAAGLRRIAPDGELTVLSGDPAATESEHGLRSVPRGLARVYGLARRSDLLISGGGGLLQDVTSWRSPLYYLGVMRAARAAGVPVACVGQGIGPLRRGFVRGLARGVLSRVDTLAVRDVASQRLLRELGVVREAEVTADLAFLLPRPTEEEVALARRKAGISTDARPMILVALRPPMGGASLGELAARVARGLGDACERLGVQAVFIPMQPALDSTVAERVAGQMPGGGLLVREGLSARELLALTAGCELAVGMRMHALVFAAICGVAPVAISYDPKVDELMGQIGLEPAMSADRIEQEALSRAIGETWENRAAIGRQVLTRAKELRGAALRNVEVAVGLLSGGGGGACAP